VSDASLVAPTIAVDLEGMSYRFRMEPACSHVADRGMIGFFGRGSRPSMFCCALFLPVSDHPSYPTVPGLAHELELDADTLVEKLGGTQIVSDVVDEHSRAATPLPPLNASRYVRQIIPVSCGTCGLASLFRLRLTSFIALLVNIGHFKNASELQSFRIAIKPIVEERLNSMNIDGLLLNTHWSAMLPTYTAHSRLFASTSGLANTTLVGRCARLCVCLFVCVGGWVGV
jgi:hypothetical protein